MFQFLRVVKHIVYFIVNGNNMAYGIDMVWFAPKTLPDIGKVCSILSSWSPQGLDLAKGIYDVNLN